MILDRYLLDDLKCDEFREHGLSDVKEKKANLVASTAAREIVILHNLLISDSIAPQFVPMLEAGGVSEVIQIYLKSKYSIPLRTFQLNDY